MSRKTFAIALMALLSCAGAKTQENFRWDVTANSPGSKEQLYADTQDYVCMTWRTLPPLFPE